MSHRGTCSDRYTGSASSRRDDRGRHSHEGRHYRELRHERETHSQDRHRSRSRDRRRSRSSDRYSSNRDRRSRSKSPTKLQTCTSEKASHHRPLHCPSDIISADKETNSKPELHAELATKASAEPTKAKKEQQGDNIVATFACNLGIDATADLSGATIRDELAAIPMRTMISPQGLILISMLGNDFKQGSILTETFSPILAFMHRELEPNKTQHARIASDMLSSLLRQRNASWLQAGGHTKYGLALDATNNLHSPMPPYALPMSMNIKASTPAILLTTARHELHQMRKILSSLDKQATLEAVFEAALAAGIALNLRKLTEAEIAMGKSNLRPSFMKDKHTDLKQDLAITTAYSLMRFSTD